MAKQILLGLIILVAPAVFAEDHPYCLLPSCPNRTHVYCQFPEVDKPGPSCGSISMRGLTDDEKTAILSIYNNRNKPSISLYEEPDSSAPPNFRPRRRRLNFRVLWDSELEKIAQRWADQCTVGGDKCRNVERFRVRQRTHFAKDPRYVPEVRPIALRFNHYDFQPSLLFLDFQGETMEDGAESVSTYFSSLMHLVEDRIGCGAMRTYDNYNEFLYLVCNFGISEPENPE